MRFVHIKINTTWIFTSGFIGHWWLHRQPKCFLVAFHPGPWPAGCKTTFIIFIHPHPLLLFNTHNLKNIKLFLNLPPSTKLMLICPWCCMMGVLNITSWHNKTKTHFTQHNILPIFYHYGGALFNIYKQNNCFLLPGNHIFRVGIFCINRKIHSRRENRQTIITTKLPISPHSVESNFLLRNLISDN